MRTPLFLMLFLPMAALAQGEQPPPTEEKVPELLKPQPGGLTSQQVAEKAIATSYTAKAADEALRAAAARADAAWAQFLPRASGFGRYTRLSEFTPPDIMFAPGVTVPGSSVFPLIFNNWNFQASLTVPFSDYFLRIAQSYSAATLSRDAARYDAAAARAKAGSDGRVAYYQWVRARGAQVVATQQLENNKTHAKDAQNIFTVGRASKADVMTSESRVAAAELALERTKNLVDLTQKQVRVAMHEEGEEPLSLGEDLSVEPAPFQGNLSALTSEAMAQRAEIKSLETSAESLRKNATATRNGMFPQFAGVANVTLASPNPRRFPQREEFFPTWDLSLQLTWSPNDILIAGNQGSALDSQANQLEAQKQALKDGIAIEVTQAWQQLKEAELALETTKRQLASAREGYRVAHELFLNGTATSTQLTDAELALTAAGLDRVNALVDSRIARVRLEHAVGRDVKLAP